MKIRHALITSAAISLSIGSAEASIFGKSKDKFVDPCANASRELLHAEGSGSRLIVGRTLLGGVVGAGIGALLSGGSTKGVLTGALAGAGVGAASAYLEEKKRANDDRAALAGSVYSDIANANAEAARALRAFVEVRQCRVTAASSIKTDVQQGKITREAGVALLAEHRKRLENEIEASQKFSKAYDDSLAKFRSAASYLTEGRATDQAYLNQIMPDGGTTPAAVVIIARAENVRGTAAATGVVVGKVAVGDPVQVTGPDVTGWRPVLLGDGTKGFLSLRAFPPAKVAAKKAVNVAQVSPETQTVVKPLFEGVQKRSALDREVQLARNDASGATFSL